MSDNFPKPYLQLLIDYGVIVLIILGIVYAVIILREPTKPSPNVSTDYSNCYLYDGCDEYNSPPEPMFPF